jgi:hypothetical protein
MLQKCASENRHKVGIFRVFFFVCVCMFECMNVAKMCSLKSSKSEGFFCVLCVCVCVCVCLNV